MSGLLRSFRSDFRETVDRRNEQTALLDRRSDSKWTYGELHRLINAIGNRLMSEADNRTGAVVSILPNGIEQFIILFAAVNAGLDFAPLNSKATLREFTSWLRLTNASLCLAPRQLGADYRTAAAEAGCICLMLPLDAKFDWVEDPAPQPDGNVGRLMLFTSGTTGDPKALIFDFDRLWSAGYAWAEYHGCQNCEDRFLNFLPMSNLGGTFNLGVIPLAAEGSVVVSDTFSGRTFFTFWQDVERFRVSILWFVPTIVRGLLKMARETDRQRFVSTVDTIKTCFIGTAPIDLETKLSFEQEFGVDLLENFALSETTFITSERLGTLGNRADRSVGEVLPYVDVQIATPTDGRSVSQYGEILVKSPFMFLGYLGAGGAIDLPLSNDGFFATGDLGRLDGNGNLILGGRLKEIVKKGGYLVVLSEIESLAERNVLVEEAAAVGTPHEFYGEDFVLFVKFRSDAGSPESLVANLRSWITANLASYKWPGEIVPRQEFPRTESGKVMKHALFDDT